MARAATLLPALLGALLSIGAAGAQTTPGWARGELAPGQLAFARAYGDHMVLAAGPAKASVWGYGSPGTTVRVSAAQEAEGSVVSTADAVVGADGTWKAYLPPVAAGSAAHTVTATSGAQSVALKDVLFGAVWVCGGQSNMEYTTGGFPAFPGAQDNVTNATKEIAAAGGFPL